MMSILPSTGTLIGYEREARGFMGGVGWGGVGWGGVGWGGVGWGGVEG